MGNWVFKDRDEKKHEKELEQEEKEPADGVEACRIAWTRTAER